ncbi:MAG: PIG-L family deacetylase [Anaerolineae bacterium]
MKHVYLSPHLDDAVLSCGGAIHQQVAGGEEVLVITLFAGDAPGDRPLSEFACGQPAHQIGAPQPAALRRAEDAAALALLGAGAVHLGLLDAIYRRGRRDAGAAAGVWLYDDVQTLMEPAHPADPVTPTALADGVAAILADEEAPLVYAPLAVGGHVDHRLVHAAARLLAERGQRLAFYEDYPYAEQLDPQAIPPPVVAATAEGENWSPEIVALAPADVAAKVAALAYYRSQLAVLFGEAEAMPSRVWSFAASRSPEAALAERIWWYARD